MNTKWNTGLIVFFFFTNPAFSEDQVRNIGTGQIGTGLEGLALATYISDDASYSCVNVALNEQTSAKGSRNTTQCYTVSSAPRLTKGDFGSEVILGKGGAIREFKIWDSANHVICGGALHIGSSASNLSSALSCVKVDSIPSKPLDRRATIGEEDIATLVNPARPAEGSNVEHSIRIRMMSDYESYACVTAHAFSKRGVFSGGSVVSTSCYPISHEPNFIRKEFPTTGDNHSLKHFLIVDQANHITCGGSLMDNAADAESGNNNLSVSISCAVQ